MSLNLIKLQERTSGNGMTTVFQMTLPKSIVKKLKWNKGDKLVVKRGFNCIKIKKKEGGV